jgi:hypothetical protein
MRQWSHIGGKATSHWVMLGSRAIEFVGTSGIDAIPVSDKGDYQQIRFKIDGRGTTIQEITVAYFDGSQQEMRDTNVLMAPGQFSKTIILALNQSEFPGSSISMDQAPGVQERG